MDSEYDSTEVNNATGRKRNSIISSIIKSCNNNTISDENMNVRSSQNNESAQYLGKPLEHLGANRVSDQLGSNLHEFNLEPLPFTDYSLFEENYDMNELRVNVNPFLKDKHIYMPNVPVHVTVIPEKRSGPHIFSQFNFKLKLKHGNYEWELSRSYKELKDIYRHLADRIKNEMGINCANMPLEQVKKDWPLFPVDLTNAPAHIEQKSKYIALFLQRILSYPPYRDDPFVSNLLNVSPLSFVKDLGPSLIEESLLKRADNGNNIFYCQLNKFKKCWEKGKIFFDRRWFCLKDTYLVYLNQKKDNQVGYVMLVDRGFKFKKTSKPGAYHCIKISNLQRNIFLKFRNAQQQNEWYEKIQYMLKTTGKYFYDTSYLPNDSFVPVRENQLCRWYINAGQYYEHVMHALNNAKEEIFITGWWLWPELFLKRPTDDLQYRLDKILLKKAKEGVKIYIIIFKEFTFAINLDLFFMSGRAKKILTQNGKNPNIKLIRYPKNFGPLVSLWTPHEKCVIIDQSIGFMGGIDLCLGRWDDDLHRIIDLGTKENITEIIPVDKSKTSLTTKKSRKSFLEERRKSQKNAELPSDSISSIRTSQVNEAENSSETSDSLNNNRVNPTIQAGNAAIVAALIGKQHAVHNNNNSSTTDFMNNFPDGYNAPKSPNRRRHRKSNESDHYVDEMDSDSETDLNEMTAREGDSSGVESSDFSKSDDLDSVSDGSKNETESNVVDQVEYPKIQNNGYYWIGKEYYNTYVEEFTDVANYLEDQLSRTEVPRMPWRDHGVVLIGDSARDLARHFIQKWNQCKIEKARKNDKYPYLLPKSYSEPISTSYKEWFPDTLYKCTVQLTRSLDTWSGGLSQTETSILNAYCDLIRNAEHFIFIENQYFITTTDPEHDNIIKNTIGLEISNRIIKAHKAKQKFRVYVVLALLPGLENQNQIQAVQYYNLRSILMGDFSIYKALQKAGIEDPTEYITFHGMRSWAVLMGKLVQEIIYVHSKTLIVDDRYVICGSANINDRSLIGKRDSELAAVIRDEELISSKLDGKRVQVGKFAFSFRQKLFRLLIGCYFNNPDRIDVTDVVCDDFYQLFRSISAKNTAIYDEVFKCIPSDNILTFDDLKNYTSRDSLNKSDPVQGKAKMDMVSGFIVDFPLKFLSKEENFFPEIYTPEGIAPTTVWT